jgi:hypothetical protein
MGEKHQNSGFQGYIGEKWTAKEHLETFEVLLCLDWAK